MIATSDYVKEFKSRGKTYFYTRAPLPGCGKIRLRVATREEANALAAEYVTAAKLNLPVPYKGLASEREEKLYRRLVNEYVSGFLLQESRGRAARRNMAFEIDADHMTAVLAEQEYCCAITGLAFQFGFGPRKRRGQEPIEREPYRPSIDRINNKLGYVPGNCRVVLVAVNIAISTWDDAVFMKIAAAAVAHRQRSEKKADAAKVPKRRGLVKGIASAGDLSKLNGNSHDAGSPRAAG